MRISIVFREIKNVPGALVRASEPFVRRGVELLNISSQPRRGVRSEYIFTLELEIEEKNETIVAEAIAELAKLGVCCSVEK